MNKNLYIFPFLMILLSLSLIGQNLTLSNENGQLNFGDTIHVFIANDDAVETHVYITNTSTNAIDVLVKKDIIDLLPAAYSTFCWGQCFAPHVIISPNSITIESNATNTNGFYSDYSAMGEDGYSVVRFVFYDENNVNDSNHVFIKYHSSPTSVNESLSIISEISNPFPNPANNLTSFNYVLAPNVKDAKIVIMNVTGQIVQEVKLQQGTSKVTVNLSQHSNGLYFYSLIANNTTVSTRKLIIQK